MRVVGNFYTMTKICYDCGKPIIDTDATKEHIPAQCLYVGYGPEYKQNRITVEAHSECNSKYSKIDQELRDAIGIMTNNQTDKAELTAKSARSILRRQNGIERISSQNGNSFVDFNYSELKELHVKNFKGLFMHVFGLAVPESLRIEIITEGDQNLFPFAQIEQLYGFMENAIPEWRFSGHPDIFKYKMAVMSANGLEEYNPDSNEQIILGTLVYHEEILCFVFATTNEMINKMTKK